MRVVAFVPAKGTSERIWNKNVSLLDGKPLILHTLEKLCAIDAIDLVVLDTESEDVWRLAAELPVQRLRRDPALATNATDGHELFLNEVKHTDADICLQVLCTAPFVAPATIRKAIDILTERPEVDSVLLTRCEKQYRWENGRPAYGEGRVPNSVDLPATVIEAMSFYAMRRDAALDTGKRYGRNPVLLEAGPMETIDINQPEDFALAELVAAGLREKEQLRLATISEVLSSPMLSDILDDLGHDGVVHGLRPNIAGARFFGRAKTLKLRALEAGEDYRGIYDALETYRGIVPGDVVVVENGLPGFAYFGELNARLARRCGALGAIIDGMTRDSADVARLDLPVFARGNNCADVRRRATVEHWGRRILIGGVMVRPGDLIFADGDGVVVIPRYLEERVLDLALEAARRERAIACDIALGIETDAILARQGEF